MRIACVQPSMLPYADAMEKRMEMPVKLSAPEYQARLLVRVNDFMKC